MRSDTRSAAGQASGAGSAAGRAGGAGSAAGRASGAGSAASQASGAGSAAGRASGARISGRPGERSRVPDRCRRVHAVPDRGGAGRDQACDPDRGAAARGRAWSRRTWPGCSACPRPRSAKRSRRWPVRAWSTMKPVQGRGRARRSTTMLVRSVYDLRLLLEPEARPPRRGPPAVTGPGAAPRMRLAARRTRPLTGLNAAWPTVTSTAPSTSAAATPCSSACWMTCVTRPRWCPRRPGSARQARTWRSRKPPSTEAILARGHRRRRRMQRPAC